jgi:hypothetical protein
VRTRHALALLGAGLCWVGPVSAQQATERYVPIGRSPGLSDGSTLMATVEKVDADSGRLTLRAASGSREVETDAATRIWMDRTALGESNAVAGVSDCREGLFVEVKLDPTGRRAEWIKLRAPEGH